MKKRKQTTKRREKTNRMFCIVKVFLAITPIICYFYVSLLAMQASITFQEVIEQESSVAVLFLISMINPYIAYLVQLIQKKLETKDFSYALINMIFLLIAQILTMNVFYFMMLLFVFYRAIQEYQIDTRHTIMSFRWKQSLYCGGGSMIVMLISSICLFASIQLM